MNNKVALITGAAVRLGRELALSMAMKNYTIALHYNGSEKMAQKTRESIMKNNGKCEIFKADLSSSHSLVEEVKDKFGRIDVLINSASWYQQATIADTTEEDFDKVVAINLKAPFFLIKHFVKHTQDQKGGHIINILDNKIQYNQFVYAAYLLTKKSLSELTRMAALEFGPNVRVNAISPGVVMPAETRDDSYISFRIKGIPLAERGWPLHINKALDYLLDNSFLTGQILTIDGGENINITGRNAIQYYDE